MRRWHLSLALLVPALVIVVVVIAGGRASSAKRSAVTAPRIAALYPANHWLAHTPPRGDPQRRSARTIVDRILRYTSEIAAGSRRRREIALTFDDGPSVYTPRILAILRRERVPATFFEIGLNVRAHPRIAVEVHRDGMLIGDHTETHPMMALLPPAAQGAELDGLTTALRALGIPHPVVFRPPYGSFDATTLRLARRRHMLTVLWTVDTSDYARPGVRRIEYTALSGARPGAIILFHDGGGPRSETIAALPVVIAALRRRHFRLVTLTQLLRDDPPRRHQGPPRHLEGD